MKNIFGIAFTTLFVTGCATVPRPILSNEQLKTGGYVFAALTIDSAACSGTMMARKIETANPLKLDDKNGVLLMFSPRATLNPLQAIIQDSDVKPVYLPSGHYGIVHASCMYRSGNTTFNYTIGNGGTGTIATFDVKSGEVVDLGQMNMQAAFKGFLFTRKFSHISSRIVSPQKEGTLQNFNEKNPTYTTNIITRHMIATPVAARPIEELPQ